MFVIPDRFLLSFIDNSICSHDGIAKKFDLGRASLF